MSLALMLLPIEDALSKPLDTPTQVLAFWLKYIVLKCMTSYLLSFKEKRSMFRPLNPLDFRMLKNVSILGATDSLPNEKRQIMAELLNFCMCHNYTVCWAHTKIQQLQPILIDLMSPDYSALRSHKAVSLEE